MYIQYKDLILETVRSFFNIVMIYSAEEGITHTPWFLGAFTCLISPHSFIRMLSLRFSSNKTRSVNMYLSRRLERMEVHRKTRWASEDQRPFLLSDKHCIDLCINCQISIFHYASHVEFKNMEFNRKKVFSQWRSAFLQWFIFLLW